MFECLVVNNKLISNALWLHKLAQKFLSPNTTQVLSHQPRHQPYLPSPSTFNTIHIIQHHPHLHPPPSAFVFSKFSFPFLSFHFSLQSSASAHQRIRTPMHPYANTFACQRSIQHHSHLGFL